MLLSRPQQNDRQAELVFGKKDHFLAPPEVESARREAGYSKTKKSI
jgi:hypothetical protein